MTAAVETVTVGRSAMLRVKRPDGQTRTGPALVLLAELRELADADQARAAELQADLHDAENAVRNAVADGVNATEARATVTRLQADLHGIHKRARQLSDLSENIRAAEVARIAKPIAEQTAAAIASAVAHLPTVPQPT